MIPDYEMLRMSLANTEDSPFPIRFYSFLRIYIYLCLPFLFLLTTFQAALRVGNEEYLLSMQNQSIFRKECYPLILAPNILLFLPSRYLSHTLTNLFRESQKSDLSSLIHKVKNLCHSLCPRFWSNP